MKLDKSLFLTALILFFMIFQNSLYTKASESIESGNSKTVNVDIKLFTFKPKVLEIKVGTTVVWTNGDAIEHSVTSGTPENPGKDFDSGFFVEGETFSFTFTKQGEYSYFCRRHESMQAVVKVVP